MDTKALPDWAHAAAIVMKFALVDVMITLLLTDIEQKRSMLQQMGFEVQIMRCKI